MADKTSTADLTVRASFAVAQAVFIAMSLPLFYALLPDSVRTMLPLFLFVIIPILSFLTSMFMNWFLQYMFCGGVSVGTISMAAGMSPLLLIVLSLLSYFLPFLRSPVTQLFSELPQESPEEAKFGRELWGYCFYLFWGGLYGQTVASGMAAVCP
jgi:hypothetical protein